MSTIMIRKLVVCYAVLCGLFSVTVGLLETPQGWWLGGGLLFIASALGLIIHYRGNTDANHANTGWLITVGIMTTMIVLFLRDTAAAVVAVPIVSLLGAGITYWLFAGLIREPAALSEPKQPS